VDFGDIEALIGILERCGLSEIEIEQDGRRIRLTKQVQAMAMPHQTSLQIPPASPFPNTRVAVPGAAAEEDNLHLEPGMFTVDSPMVGTFYVSTAPGEPPFVQANDAVEADQTVCIVEAMKIMNEVVARQPGVIVRVLVENGESVEFGQPLFVVRSL
jgi:acetyl-CoA carboxylase biotin carboxyl carrier protein